MRALILGIVLGAAWGVINTIVLGIAITMVLGEPATLTGAAAALAGAVGAAVWLLLDTRKSPQRAGGSVGSAPRRQSLENSPAAPATAGTGGSAFRRDGPGASSIAPEGAPTGSVVHDNGRATTGLPRGWWRSRRFIAGLVAFVIVMTLATYTTPLGFALTTRPLGGVLVLLALGLSTVGAVALCFESRSWRNLRRYQLEVVIIRALKGFGLLFFSALVVFPFYAMLMTSFKTQSNLLQNPLDYSIDVTQGFSELFSSYIELFTTFNFGRFIAVSSLVSVLTVLFTLAAAIPGAYAVARLRFPGRTTLSRSILLIYMVPAIVLVIPLYAVFSQMGLRDSLAGLLIVYPATTIPVALYMLQGYFRGLPAELEEAGLMDGCNRLGVIWRITMPLSLPAIASVALYVFMIAWNEFLFAFMFLDTPDIFTLSRGVVSLNSSEVPRQHLMAGAVIVTVPVLVIFLWFERFLVTGLTAGSVKG